MTISYASGKTLILATKLTPGGILTVTSNPGPTNGRLYFVNDNQVEFLEYTTVTPSGANFILGGLTRDLDTVAIPATSLSTGKTWLATNSCVLVAMHDQLIDIQKPTQILQEGKTYATPAVRDTALGANGVATFSYTDIYVTSTGLFYNYNLSTAQWEVISTGTATPNASETVAGKGEVAIDAEITTPTDLGGTGAFLWAKISQLVKLFSFAPILTTSAETDYYAFQDTTNGNKTTRILKSNLRNDLASSTTLKGTVERATDTEASIRIDTTRYITPSQLPVFPGTTVTYFSSAGGSTISTSYITLATYIATRSGTYIVQYSGSHGNNFSGSVRVTVDGIPLSSNSSAGGVEDLGILGDQYSSSTSSTLYGLVALGKGQVINFEGKTTNAGISTTISAVTIKGDV